MFNLHQMYQENTGESEYIYRMRNDSAERFAFSFMYSNTQFRTKIRKTVYSLDEKARFILLGYIEAFKIAHAR